MASLANKTRQGGFGKGKDEAWWTAGTRAAQLGLVFSNADDTTSVPTPPPPEEECDEDRSRKVRRSAEMLKRLRLDVIAPGGQSWSLIVDY